MRVSFLDAEHFESTFFLCPGAWDKRMKKPFFSITDLVVVAILLVSGTAAWRRLEL